MDEQVLSTPTAGAIGRREALKKAAAAGAVVAWGAPVVQTLGAGGAFAQSASECAGCMQRFGIGAAATVTVSATTDAALIQLTGPPDPADVVVCDAGCVEGSLGAANISWLVASPENLPATPPAQVSANNLLLWYWLKPTVDTDSSADVTVILTVTCGTRQLSCRSTTTVTWPAADGNGTVAAGPFSCDHPARIC
jgi:hypothetical protein